MTKGNYSLEVRSALENKGLLNTKLFLICGFVYHPLKLALAIRWNILLHKCLGRKRLYVVETYEYLGHIGLFTRSSQFVPALG